MTTHDEIDYRPAVKCCEFCTYFMYLLTAPCCGKHSLKVSPFDVCNDYKVADDKYSSTNEGESK